jgi:hypothetical protein
MKPRPGDQSQHSHVALLSILLEKRKLGWAMLGGGLAYFALSLLGISLLACPMKTVTGWDCPGCGLTRGTRVWLQGDWQAAMNYHWFTPVFIVFWAAVGFGLIIPEPWRGRFLAGVKTSERVTRWPLVLGVCLVIYALTRNFLIC